MKDEQQIGLPENPGANPEGSQETGSRDVKSTPGPWHVYEGLNFIKVGSEGYDEYVERQNYLGGPFCVANVDDRATEDYSEDRAKGLANACLIAAAPELYEALDWLCACTEEGMLPGKDRLAQAQAALAKARGEL